MSTSSTYALSAPTRADHLNDEIVLVGHGSAWTVLVAELTGAEPDIAFLRALRFPDLISL